MKALIEARRYSFYDKLDVGEAVWLLPADDSSVGVWHLRRNGRGWDVRRAGFIMAPERQFRDDLIPEWGIVGRVTAVRGDTVVIVVAF